MCNASKALRRRPSPLVGQRAPDYLVLATHGFARQQLAPAIGRRRRGGPEPESEPTAEAGAIQLSLVDVTGPLRNCGLVLAGSEGRVRVAGEDPRLVTAEDIFALDLSRTRLVVLTACSSAAGSSLLGQGMFSVRKAFFRGGARSVIGAIGPIDDESTAELMRDFYAAFAESGLGALALSRAQRRYLERHPNAPAEDWALLQALGIH